MRDTGGGRERAGEGRSGREGGGERGEGVCEQGGARAGWGWRRAGQHPWCGGMPGDVMHTCASHWGPAPAWMVGAHPHTRGHEPALTRRRNTTHCPRGEQGQTAAGVMQRMAGAAVRALSAFVGALAAPALLGVARVLLTGAQLRALRLLWAL